jgi:hypothetical protein
MLRAQLSPARSFDIIEKNNTPIEFTSPVFTGADMSLMRLSSLSTVSTDTSGTLPAEMELSSPLCSPATSPRAQPISVELSRLQDQLSQLEKELAEAFEKKDWRKQELTSAADSLHSTYAELLMERLLLPRLGSPLRIYPQPVEDKPIKVPAADTILLPMAKTLEREDTSSERFPRRAKTINAADAIKIKIQIFNKLVKEDHIKNLLAASDTHINELTQEIEDTEAKIVSEKNRIAEEQNAAAAPNHFAFFQLREIPSLETDQPENKRQRRNGPAQ